MIRRQVVNPIRFERCMWISEGPCCAREQWQICLDVRSAKQAGFFRALTPFKVCTGHKKAVDLGAILDRGGWSTVQAAFRHQGKKEPRRRLTELAFERLEELEHHLEEQRAPRLLRPRRA